MHNTPSLSAIDARRKNVTIQEWKKCIVLVQKIVSDNTVAIWGQLGMCGKCKVFIGFAPASTLSAISFADQLDEETGKGYQRRFNREHSQGFQKYIQQSGASTIPLTFNLRPEHSDSWELIPQSGDLGPALLQIDPSATPVMSQVDCQHRLGYLDDSEIPFAFMSYIGLSVTEEMELFRIINGKAKGLSGSLLDFTEAKLLSDNLSSVKPELYIALEMHQNPKSPWYQRLDLGGTKTVGMTRQASLRMMQKAAKRFLRESKLSPSQHKEHGPHIVMNFWNAVRLLLPTEWDHPRKNMLTKGIGVYSLMRLAGHLTREAIEAGINCDETYFVSKLSGFIDKIDWANHGSFQGFGGVSGAEKAFEVLMATRSKSLGAVPLYG